MYNDNCSICLENMEEDIYSGSCGHCFHEKCILSMKNEECPLCRISTNFFKIYLDYICYFYIIYFILFYNI